MAYPQDLETSQAVKAWLRVVVILLKSMTYQFPKPIGKSIKPKILKNTKPSSHLPINTNNFGHILLISMIVNLGVDYSNLPYPWIFPVILSEANLLGGLGQQTYLGSLFKVKSFGKSRRVNFISKNFRWAKELIYP